MKKKLMYPTLQQLDYDSNPPRCATCSFHAIEPTQKSVTRICTLTKSNVQARGVCDGWMGLNGEVLIGQSRRNL